MVINMKTTIPNHGAVLNDRTILLPGEGPPRGGGLWETELDTFSCVARGDCGAVADSLRKLIYEKTAQGGLEVGSIEEARYRATEMINVAARYAAQSCGGEMYCLGLADACVSQADKSVSRDEIFDILTEKMLELTRFVSKSKQNKEYPYIIRRSIDYINSNIGRNLSVIEVAGECNISPDYLSVYFRKTTGERMTAYIRRQKLLVARDMLGARVRCSEAAKRLSFCSESYFVKCFREEFGVTPKRWQKEH